jgi:hypothetical protein
MNRTSNSHLGQPGPNGSIHLNTALDALDLGFSPVPPMEDGTKRPLSTWKRYQATPATREEVLRWYSRGLTGDGLVTGYAGLTCFEFDDRAVYEAFVRAAVALGLGDLVERIEAGYLEDTPGGGVHWLYVCEEVRGNTKLAERPDPDRPHKRHPLIETRGEGGFVIIAPSNGNVHPTHGAYRLLRGRLDLIETLTAAEQDALWDLARTFDEIPAAAVQPRKATGAAAEDIRPGDAFEAEHSWEDILEPLGWTEVYSRGDVTYWRRPDKDRGISATTGHCKGLYVFSTSTSFEPRRSYTRFGAYAHLNHGGDYKAAAGELARQGYGTPRTKAKAAVPEARTPTAPTKAAAAAKLTCIDDVEEKDVEWLWPDRIPLGVLTSFCGDPKLGKSFTTLAITAAVSRGAALPGGIPPAGPGSVILLSAEDDPARTIKPRLRAAGAILSRIHILESIIVPESREDTPALERMPSLLAYDLEVIEAAASQIAGLKLIVIDPVSAYLAGTDDNRNTELRSVLSPLKAMAERLNIAIILVSHLAKAGGVNGKYRMIGSIAYIAACRANFLFARDKDDPAGRRVLMLDNGCNLVASPPAVAFTIEDRGEGPAVEWLAETIDKDADTYLAELAEAAAESARDPIKAEMARECEAWLKDLLASGPTLAKDVYRQASEAGYSIDQAKRAKIRIGASTRRDGFGPGSRCLWELPGTSIESGPY